MFKKPFFVTITLLVLAFVAAGLAYTQFSKPEPAPVESTDVNQSGEIDISDWKTYRNETIGIEFDYPPHWPEIKNENRGDSQLMSFGLTIPGLLSLHHTFLDYDYSPIEEQYEKIKCYQADILAVVCEEKINKYGTKYIWRVDKTKGGDLSYGALVPTGKYVLIFGFQDKENYEKNSEEYQSILNSLRIVE